MTTNLKCNFDSFKIVDNGVIDIIIEQAKGDKQFVNMLFESYLSEGEETFISIENALKDNDYTTFGKAVHALKGLSGTMGVMQVFEICKEIDSALKQSNINEALELLPELTSKYRVAEKFINSNFITI